MSIQQSIAGAAQPFAGPLYAQVAAILRGKICSSEWASTAPLPNEATLAKDIGVSVGTVRKALEMLEDERLIQRRQGRGTFVVEISEDTELERFSRLVAGGKKLKADPARMKATIEAANSEERGRLGLAADEKIIRFEAVWTAPGGFKAWERIAVPLARFPGLETLDIMSGQFLFPIYRRHYNIVINRVAEQVTCLNADESLSKMMGVRKDQAIMRIDRVARAMAIGPVEWSLRYAYMSEACYAVSMT